MRDRIVPIERTDLMNVYYTILGLTGGSAPTVIAATAPGLFDITEEGFCQEPIESADVTLASGDFYFVAAFTFAGFSIDDTAVTTEGDTIAPDGCTLYKATVADGGITIEKVSL